MLTISPINFKNFHSSVNLNCVKNKNNERTQIKELSVPYYRPMLGGGTPSFKSRVVNDIEYKEYVNMSEEEKQICRDKYENYYKLVNHDELFFKKHRDFDYLPLRTDSDMRDFLRVASAYNQYKGNKIICVGRSPKWFLNTSIWMKDGIEDYAFAAFSSNWFHRNYVGGLGPNLIRDNDREPNEQQVNAYKKYMKRIKCDPVSIIRRAEKSGRPVIITDYIHSGCGLTSYMDIMSKFAEDAGVLEDFAKSVELFTMGSTEYIEDLGYYNWYALPTAIMPERLRPYKIPQHYHDMSSSVLKSILIDKNTNECRSTYFPPAAWNIYNPMKYKTGLIPDERLRDMPRVKDGVINNYTDAMKDYRNLMNFRILDYLATHEKLKDNHKTR